MKDNFSKDADKYAKYRPTYPLTVFQYINDTVKKKIKAWDCGTGNVQIAIELASYYKYVYATDISQKQLNYGTIYTIRLS